MKKTIGILITLFIAILAMSTNSHATDVNTEADLKQQLNTGGEGVVKLTDDVIVTQNISIYGTKILDLNEHTLTIKNGKYLLVRGEVTITGNGIITTPDESTRGMVITYTGGKLTIENGTITTDKSLTTLTVYPGGTVTIENGTIRANKDGGMAINIWGSDTDNGTKTKVTIGKQAHLVGTYGIAIYKYNYHSYGVEVNVNGTIQVSRGQGITINGGVTTTTGNVPVININEGSNITSNGGPAVYTAGYGIFNINGGTLKGSEAVSIKSGIINISGGKLIANGEYKLPVANGNGPESTGSAISITSNDSFPGKAVVNITNNPVITSQNGYAIFEAKTNGNGDKVESISIKGGVFSGEKGAISIENKEDLGKIVENGTFNSNVTEYVKDGSIQVLENAVYYVGETNDIVISEDENDNGDIVISGTSAMKGQLVKIDVTAKEGYELDTVTVLDEDGREVEVSDLQFVMPNSKVTVKATFKEKATVEKPQQTETITPAEPTETIDTPNKGEKDDTPKTGSIDVVIYVSAVVAILALSSIKTIKRKNKYL